jgi:hypothetical protein
MWHEPCLLRRLAKRKISLSNLHCFTYNKLQERVDNSARSLNYLIICCLLFVGCWLLVVHKPITNDK